jgi:hypothetical protein
VRCYASALGQYEGTRWRHITDHVHTTLARQLMKLRRPELSLFFLLKLIGSGRQSYETQQALVRDLLHICRQVWRGMMGRRRMIKPRGW